jgi:pre-60S factor REI1
VATRRYNLKRKIAGLPPVTREWYEARKAQLVASAASPVQRVWFDPLTKRKFYSENTYQAFAR